jgi:hypothetical protein
MLLVLAAACHSGTGGQPGDAAEPVPKTTLTVVNQAFLDMNVYALPQDGARVRIGTVTGNSTQTFRLPEYLVRTPITMRFLLDPIGGNRAPISNTISVSPGDNVELQIPPA